jgi:NIMA (never in mitosis gene a)-related kinase
LTLEGDAKLGDLNVSKVAKQGLLHTQTGTPYYASPEVWRDLPYDAKSDVWSLGCAFYEAAALRPPFLASGLQELYKKVMAGVYPELPAQYSSDLGTVLKSLLQQRPQDRPSCCKTRSWIEGSGYLADRCGVCQRGICGNGNIGA